jgi:NADH-quinone oxidoreductase subunit I
MIVKREKLTFWERLYLPALLGGFKITARHLWNTVFRGQNTARRVSDGYYPEVPWTVGPGYRGAPYLVRDQDGNTKCVSCQLCEFICPPKAIAITPPGPAGPPADRPNAEKMPLEFEINMLRCIFCGFCQEVCPEDAIFLLKDYSLNGLTREEMIYNKEKLLAMGGTHAGIQKWKNK